MTTRILVVDDDPAGNLAVCRVLKSAGYEVFSAETGMDGMNLVQTIQPELLLLDVNLPDISGLEICRQLKADPKTQNVFVVMLSSTYIDSDSQASGLDSGADGYIARPIANRELVARVQSMLRIKATEVALRAALAEKEVLIKEVHHRVKNNLASIIALITLQQGQLTDPAMAAEFSEFKARIQAMALVHELLYQSDTLDRVDIHEYLGLLLNRLYTSFSSHGGVRLHSAAHGVEMEMDQAITVGLIVNELVTNAFKYAFRDAQSGSMEQKYEINVTAAWDGALYTLIVSDNGVGIPADLDWTATKSLGLRLVRMLSLHQLNGQLELDRSQGTTFRLRFAPKGILPG